MSIVFIYIENGIFIQNLLELQINSVRLFVAKSAFILIITFPHLSGNFRS